jgi:hypothetical protein
MSYIHCLNVSKCSHQQDGAVDPVGEISAWAGLSALCKEPCGRLDFLKCKGLQLIAKTLPAAATDTSAVNNSNSIAVSDITARFDTASNSLLSNIVAGSRAAVVQQHSDSVVLFQAQSFQQQTLQHLQQLQRFSADVCDVTRCSDYSSSHNNESSCSSSSSNGGNAAIAAAREFSTGVYNPSHRPITAPCRNSKRASAVTSTAAVTVKTETVKRRCATARTGSSKPYSSHSAVGIHVNSNSSSSVSSSNNNDNSSSADVRAQRSIQQLLLAAGLQQDDGELQAIEIGELNSAANRFSARVRPVTQERAALALECICRCVINLKQYLQCYNCRFSAYSNTEEQFGCSCSSKGVVQRATQLTACLVG